MTAPIWIDGGLDALAVELRRSSIGGSDAGAIVAGGAEWVRLWREKTGRADPEDLSNVLAVQMGQWTEPFNCAWYERHTGRAVTRRNELVRHASIPYLAANLDGATRTAAGHLAYIDFKHVGRAGDAVTLRYTAQGTHCAIVLSSVCGYPVDWFVLSIFFGNSKWELVEQEIDPFFAADYLAKCEEFWRYVERDEEPPTADPLPVPPPRQLRKINLPAIALDRDSGLPLSADDLPRWEAMARHYNWAPEISAEIEAFLGTLHAANRHAIARNEIGRLLPEDVGELRRGAFLAKRDRTGRLTMKETKDG